MSFQPILWYTLHQASTPGCPCRKLKHLIQKLLQESWTVLQFIINGWLRYFYPRAFANFYIRDFVVLWSERPGYYSYIIIHVIVKIWNWSFMYVRNFLGFYDNIYVHCIVWHWASPECALYMYTQNVWNWYWYLFKLQNRSWSQQFMCQYQTSWLITWLHDCVKQCKIYKTNAGYR